MITGGKYTEKEAWIVNIDTMEWTQLPGMEQQRTNHDCTMFGPVVLVAGSDFSSQFEFFTGSFWIQFEIEGITEPLVGAKFVEDKLNDQLLLVGGTNHGNIHSIKWNDGMIRFEKLESGIEIPERKFLATTLHKDLLICS